MKDSESAWPDVRPDTIDIDASNSAIMCHDSDNIFPHTCALG